MPKSPSDGGAASRDSDVGVIAALAFAVADLVIAWWGSDQAAPDRYPGVQWRFADFRYDAEGVGLSSMEGNDVQITSWSSTASRAYLRLRETDLYLRAFDVARTRDLNDSKIRAALQRLIEIVVVAVLPPADRETTAGWDETGMLLDPPWLDRPARDDSVTERLWHAAQSKAVEIAERFVSELDERDTISRISAYLDGVAVLLREVRIVLNGDFECVLRPTTQAELELPRRLNATTAAVHTFSAPSTHLELRSRRAAVGGSEWSTLERLVDALRIYRLGAVTLESASAIPREFFSRALAISSDWRTHHSFSAIRHFRGRDTV